MRMRKKSWAMPFIEEHPEYILQNPELNKGKWKQVLNCDILHLEIGCGKGDYFINMSIKYPNEGFVAIERDISCGAVAAKKALEQPHANNLMIIKDATELEEWFDSKEIDIIHLNFSDPWPKSGHYKRRLSYGGFLQKYKNVLSDDGEIWLKSDNKDLFEFSVCEFSKNGFIIHECSVDFRRKEQDDVITEYESKFMQLNQPIYRVVVKKK